MQVQLLIAAWCSSCARAHEIWERICTRHGLTLEILDLETPAGEAVAVRHHLKIMPAVLIDDHPRAIGVQSEDEAEAVLKSALGKPN
ncbi:MAG TPA: thioredoxin family protein [Gammaproteobacteria bacterium]